MINNYIKITKKILVNPEAWRDSGKRYRLESEFIFFDDKDFNKKTLELQIEMKVLTELKRVSVWKHVPSLVYPSILDPIDEDK